MFTTRVLTALINFGLVIAAVPIVIIVTYRLFVVVNPDLHLGREIKRGNVAAAIVVAAMLFGTASILLTGTESSVGMIRMHFLAPAFQNESAARILALVGSHLAIAMLLALLSVSFALRLFNWLDHDIRADHELGQGNVAVGILLAVVVVISSLYAREGVSALSRALIPTRSIGLIQTAK